VSEKVYEIPHTTKLVRYDISSRVRKVIVEGKCPNLYLRVYLDGEWDTICGRRCPKCEWLKEYGDFYAGQSRCKKCLIENVRENQKKNNLAGRKPCQVGGIVQKRTRIAQDRIKRSGSGG